MVEQAKITIFPQVRRYTPETAAVIMALYAGFTDAKTPAWLKSVHARNLAILQERGLPTPKLERWKYTNLNRALGHEPLTMGLADIRCDSPLVLPLHKLLQDCPAWLREILESSTTRSSSSRLPGGGVRGGGVALGDLSKQPLPPGPPPEDGRGENDEYDMQALWHLGMAFLRDGLVMDVPAGKAVDKSVEIVVNGQTGAFTAPFFMIRLGDGAQLTVIERHTGDRHYWTNGTMQIVLGPGATLRHYRIQEDSDKAVYTQTTHATLDRDATYDTFTLTTGGHLSRNQIHAELNGPGAHCSLNGINLQRGQQQADATMLVEHRAPRCASRQFLRTVLDDQAHGVFQGKVYVHKEAQKTDGYQLSNTLLLSEGAEMDTKPELEIYADDVKCSHGATTGRLDEEPLFYMRARGIPEAEARGLLIEAFLGEVLEKVADEGCRSLFTERVKTWLG